MKLPTFLSTEDIVQDAQDLATKQKVMKSLRWNSLLMSVGKATALIAGPLIAAGAIAGVTGTLNALGAAGFGAALATGFTLPVIGTLAIGALFAGIAIAADYTASRIWQSKSYDNLEINARSTAHHLVQEIESHNMCMVEHRNPARADGKSWQEYIVAQKSNGQGQSL